MFWPMEGVDISNDVGGEQRGRDVRRDILDRATRRAALRPQIQQPWNCPKGGYSSGKGREPWRPFITASPETSTQACAAKGSPVWLITPSRMRAVGYPQRHRIARAAIARARQVAPGTKWAAVSIAQSMRSTEWFRIAAVTSSFVRDSSMRRITAKGSR